MQDMRTILVHDICGVDNLTQGSSWKEVLEYIKQNIDTSENVMLDFKGINVIEPWTIDEFGDVLKFENIYFRFTSSNKESLTAFVNKIKTKCIIDGLNANRIDAIFVEPKKIKTKAEIELEKDGEEFITKFEVDNDNKSAFINMELIYSQIGSISTIEALLYAILKMNETDGIEEFTVKTGKMFIQGNIIELMAKKILEVDKSHGIKLNIDTDVEDTAQKLGLYLHTAINDSFTMKDKVQEFIKLPENLAIMLIKYKKSRAVDEFGRNGKGQVVSSRIAVVRRLCIKDGYTYLKYINRILAIDNNSIRAEIEYTPNGRDKIIETAWFDFSTIAVMVDSFNTNKFMTHAEWLTRNDGEIIDDNGKEIYKLPYDRAVIYIDDIGLEDKFLGKKYHILKPVQKSVEENKEIIVNIDDEGYCVKQTVTIPERIKIVLDDWDEKYDADELEKAIQETNNLIK